MLKSSALVPAGKKVKCPKCGQMFTTGEPKREMPPKPAAPTPPSAESLAEDDEMDAAIAKLEAEQAGGKKPVAPAVQPAPAPPPAAFSPAFGDDDDEMAAAIAKLEADQSAGAKPAAKPTPAVQPVAVKPQVAAEPEDFEVPEIDDDLVVPNEEEAPAKKKHDKKMNGSASKKKKRPEDDEEELEEIDIIDEEEEKPPSKKKKRDEEEKDEKPRSRKKKIDDSDEDEEAFSAKAQSKKKNARDEEDDEPRRGGKKKKAGSSMGLYLAVGGGLAALFLCCCGGGGGYYFFFSNPVGGHWEPAEKAGRDKIKGEWYFGSFGKGHIKISGEEFNQKIELAFHFDYTYARGNPGTLEIKITKVEGKDADFWRQGKIGQDAERYNVAFDGDSMILTRVRQQDAFGGGGFTLRRVSRW